MSNKREYLMNKNILVIGYKDKKAGYKTMYLVISSPTTPFKIGTNRKKEVGGYTARIL